MAKARSLLLVVMAALVGTAPLSLACAEGLKAAGTVTAVAGLVTAAHFEARPHPLKFRDTLYWRDVVEARRDGIARVLLGGHTTVTVRELSRLELREEAVAEGTRYAGEVVSGKVRASVARMLMRPGDEVEVRTRNAVASVRGTDFIVETAERPGQGWPFGLLGVREVVQAVLDGGSPSVETVVMTLSGVVEVSNRLAATGRRERIGGYEAVRVSGRQEPARFRLGADDLRVLLRGLTPPRPEEARSGDRAEAVGRTIQRVALAASGKRVRRLENAGGDGQPGGQSSQGVGQVPSNGQASGNSLALGQGDGQASANGLPPGQDKVQAPAAPATQGVSATPAAQGAGPGDGLGNGNGLAPSQGVGNAQPAPAPAGPATPALAATPAVPAKHSAAQAVAGRGSAGTPPGQAKK